MGKVRVAGFGVSIDGFGAGPDQGLEHPLGEREAAARLMRALERVTQAGILTPDLGGTAATTDVTTAMVDAIQSSNL